MQNIFGSFPFFTKKKKKIVANSGYCSNIIGYALAAVTM